MEQREGYKKTKIGWIPEDWELNSVKDICDVKGRIGFRGYTKQDLVKKGQGAFTIGAKHITKGNQLTFLNPEYIKWEKYYESPEIMCSVGDLLIVQRGTIGKVAIIEDLPEKATINPSMVLLKNTLIENKYLYYFLSSSESEKRILSFTSSTAVPMISQKQIKTFEIPIPPLPEQKKIASILTTVDDKILSIDQQIQQTEQLKKGLMEKLLTEGIGHTEFKETKIGKIPKGWDYGPLGINVNLMGGYAFKSKDSQEYGVKWLKIANVGHLKVVWDAKSYLPTEFAKQHKKFVLNEGDIVIAMTRPILGRKLKISFIQKSDSGALLNQRVGKFVFLNTSVLPAFFYYLVQGSKFIDDMLLKLLGSDPPNISSEMIESISVVCPPIEEQNQIASILSTVDDKIGVLNQKKSHYQTLKKGLSQQLLTGQIRVKI